ncbi:MAG: flagellar biosynthesis protein FlhA [Myxococcota bacterium]|nr:flagellar biosynthesis protein FlhA [Myxococcota bacterium]
MERQNKHFLTSILAAQGRLFETGLALAIVAVVLMMVLPLTPWLIDLLIGANLGVSVLVITLALFIKKPLQFTAFPTLLLIATLYRLALNVSSTRLILLRADAGKIIDGFGGVVVGGDILVGAVIFGILAMVLFLVITKGAERVAEVAARFSLDALPGMQLAIDSDVRAGAISSLEASRQRAELDRQSRYYGSLDGAVKFVRGDAIAGLVIICVNIVGGLLVGMFKRQMSLGEALDTYTRLTIGDGLVTLIPALLVSTAAGLLTTRVGQGTGDGKLGEQLGRQLFAEPRALAAASAALLVLCVVPGLPAWPFALFGSGLGIAAAAKFRDERRTARRLGEAELSEPESDPVEPAATIELGGDLHARLSKEAAAMGGWGRIAEKIAAPLQEALGLPLRTVPVVDGGRGLAVDAAQVRVRGRTLMIAPKPTNNGNQLDEIIEEAIAHLRAQAHRLIGLDETQHLLDSIARHRPVLIRETVPKIIRLPMLTALLADLVRDGISLVHLPEILEAVSRIPAWQSHDDLTRSVRGALSHVITDALQSKQMPIQVATFSPDVTAVLESAMVQTEQGDRLALAPDIASQIAEACHSAMADMSNPVLIVPALLRRPIAEMFSGKMPHLAVVAHGEIAPDAAIEVVCEVDV